MNVNKLPATHIAQQLFNVINEASDAREIIESIEITDSEFAELISCTTVKSTMSKWYGSNEGGFAMTDIQMRDMLIGGVKQLIPVSCYFCGVKIVRV